MQEESGLEFIAHVFRAAWTRRGPALPCRTAVLRKDLTHRLGQERMKASETVSPEENRELSGVCLPVCCVCVLTDP